MRQVPPVSIGSGEKGFDVAEQRQRLFLLCCRWTNDTSAAEDLAQETILIGLRRIEPPREWPSYLFGIARRLCQKWQMQRGRDDARFSTREESPSVDWSVYQETLDPLESLIQSERETLIEQALGALKAPVRELLIARYIHELPLSEIAAQKGLSENAATVRVHRGREALRRVLETALRDEAASHGLLEGLASQGWRETPLYCVRCGHERLIGRFEVQTGAPPDFALDCKNCQGQLIGMTSHVQPMDTGSVLAGVSGFRAGLNRVNQWWQGYIASALQTRFASCVCCGHPSTVRIGTGASAPGLSIYCDACRETTFYIHPTGLLYHSDAAQGFWRQYPRMHHQDARVIQCEGRPALLTTFVDRLTVARLEMVFDLETLRSLRVETIGR